MGGPESPLRLDVWRHLLPVLGCGSHWLRPAGGEGGDKGLPPPPGLAL